MSFVIQSYTTVFPQRHRLLYNYEARDQAGGAVTEWAAAQDTRVEETTRSITRAVALNFWKEVEYKNLLQILLVSSGAL